MLNKKDRIQFAIFIIVLIAYVFVAPVNSCMQKHLTHERPQETENVIFDGMFFSTDNVTDEIFYGDTIFGCDSECYIHYSDVDANIPGTIIPIDSQTYQKIIQAKENNKTITGVLRINSDIKTFGLCETI